MPRKISNKKLLTELTRLADGGLGPTVAEIRENGEYSVTPYKTQFGTIWRAVVRAGLTPRWRRPLSPSEYSCYHDSALSQQKPAFRLAGLLGMFTGLPAELIPSLSESWITERKHNILVSVPAEHTLSGDKWDFQLPAKWTDEGQTKQTELPGLLSWYFKNRSPPLLSHMGYTQVNYSIAADAGLEQRRQVERELASGKRKTVPEVRLEDLRMTGGIRMARSGAPARRIRRHLGIDHTGWQARVQDFFIWCDIHDNDFSHPDYDPPDTVLNPV